MKKIICLAVISMSLMGKTWAQTSIPIALKSSYGDIKGTLLMPANAPAHVKVALIIAGSGPTDRDGNSGMTQNNSLKLLAEALAAKGIASVRYDKRGIAESKDAALMEADLRFDTYVDDAVDWIKMLKADTRFDGIFVLGHSEGSLIGMIAALKGNASAYVSLEGAGRPIDQVLREQLNNAPAISKQAGLMMDTLLKGDTLKYVPSALYSLFRPSVQPYMISWMKYDPAIEIKKLKIPILIVQGTTDIQTSLKDANRLRDAAKGSQLSTISGMNHIFKMADADRLKNIATYNKPELPLATEFVKALINFLLNVKP